MPENSEVDVGATGHVGREPPISLELETPNLVHNLGGPYKRV